MTDKPGTALAVLEQIRAQARAGAEALDGLNRAAEALEGIIQEGLEGPFKGVFNALPNGAVRNKPRGKIEQDPELQAFIGARVMTLTFPEVAAQVAAHFPPERRVTTSTIHRWWHRRGKKPKPPTGCNRLSPDIPG